MISIASSLTILYNNKLAKIITSDDGTSANNAYENMLTEAQGMGADRLFEFDNEMFKAYKQKLGMSFGFPPNDPNSGYSSLKVESLFGNTSYNKVIPENIARK